MQRAIRPCLLLIFIISGLLSSCSLAPKYKQPHLPVAAAYPFYEKTTGPFAYDTDWWTFFRDPYLRKLIVQALANNRDLRVTALRIKEAEALYKIERSRLFPTINFDAFTEQARIPQDLSVTGMEQIARLYQVDLGFTLWELDFWGRLRSLKKAALENFLASDETHRAATLSLISQVAENYLVLRSLNERIIWAKRTVASHQKSFDIFTKRFRVGAISKLDLSQVETLLIQAEELLAQLEQEREAAKHFLTLIVGTIPIPLPENIYLDDRIVLNNIGVGLPSSLLIERPDIVAAEHRLKAAGANIGAARAAFFPKITLTDSYGTASAELNGLFKSGSRIWTFVPDLTLPIFDAGRNRATLYLTKVRRDVAIADYEKTIQVAFREVSDALSARFWSVRQLAIHRRMLAAATERARLAQLRYDNGAAPYLEVLDAERDLLSAQQLLVQTRRAVLTSRVRLYTALGGGNRYLPYAMEKRKPEHGKKSFNCK